MHPSVLDVSAGIAAIGLVSKRIRHRTGGRFANIKRAWLVVEKSPSRRDNTKVSPTTKFSGTERINLPVESSGPCVRPSWWLKFGTKSSLRRRQMCAILLHKHMGKDPE